MKREKLQETETLIRWDETDDPAVLYTASAKVRREWESYGYTAVEGDPFHGWTFKVPKDRITYKPLKKS